MSYALYRVQTDPALEWRGNGWRRKCYSENLQVSAFMNFEWRARTHYPNLLKLR